MLVALRVTELHDEDRQRLKIFICRLAGSKDTEAIERRARLFVDVVMRGILEAEGLPLGSRSSARFAWASARFLFSLAGGRMRPGKLSMRSAGATGKPKVYGRLASSILSARLSMWH